MKKGILGLLILGALIFSGCDSGPSTTPGDGSGTGNKFSPPSWIIGEWSDGAGAATFVFTSDNITFTTTIGTGITTDFKADYVSDEYTVVEDPKTETEYTVTLSEIVSGQKIEIGYKFVKISETTMDYSGILSGETFDSRTLTKKETQ